MMQRLKNYRERLGYSHATANEREGADRRGGETKEQREDRLQQMREMQHERRGAETEEQREDRLQQMREMQHERRGEETKEQREDRLQQMSLHSTAAISASRLPKCTSSAKCLLMATNTTLSGSPHKCPAFH